MWRRVHWYLHTQTTETLKKQGSNLLRNVHKYIPLYVGGLKSSRRFIYWLSWKGLNNNWGILFQSFNQIRRKNSWEKTWFAKEKTNLWSGQCNRPQKCFGNGKIKGSALWIVGTSTTPFLRFGSLWLLSLPRTQTLPRWSAFFFESRGNCSCRGVFCKSYEEPLHGRDNGAGASLE